MSDSAVQSATAVWRAKLPHEWDTSDRVPEMAPAEISFGELLSALNPLQHIPVIGSIYREITGETLHPVARVIGGALIGGPLGLVTSAFNSLIEQATGKDLGAQALALILPDAAPPPADTAIAGAEPAAPDSTPAQVAQTTVPADTAATAPTPMWPTPVADLAAVAPASGVTPKAATPAGEPQGRALAYYQNHAGQRLPMVGNMTTQRTAMTATPNPTLQRQPLVAPPAAPVPTPVTKPAPDAANEPADVWFANAMMQGLDRYRETKRLQRNEPPAIDVTH